MSVEDAERTIDNIQFPFDLWVSKKFTLQEKIILIELNSLSKLPEGCFADYDHFGELLNLGYYRVKEIFANLYKKNAVIRTKTDGRKQWRDISEDLKPMFGVRSKRYNK